MQNHKAYFITGTDTGVGKTLVTGLLTLHLQARGIDVGVMKPFATGCEWHEGKLIAEDAVWLQEATGIDDDLDLINPVRLEEPLAPLVAARREGKEAVDFLARFNDAYNSLCERHEVVLVEGVGGLLVPIQENAETGLVTCADLVNRYGWPVVVVARRTLGTINHTVLTCRTALVDPARFEALVFSDAHPVEDSDVAAHTSPPVIREMTGLPIWGQVPYLIDLSRPTLQDVAATYLSEAFPS